MQLNENSLIETMFDVMPFAVYVVDVKSLDIIHMNRVMVRRKGGNYSGRRCHNALYDRDSQCIHCKIDDILDEQRKPNGLSITYEHFDEMDDCWYQIQDKAITWPDGRVVKCSIAVDISELKEMQNHLAEAHAQLALKNRELEKATRYKDEFLANISHEIRTPLNAVIGLSDLALKTELTLQQHDYLKKIHTSSASLMRIINDILDFSKIEAGRIDLEHIPFELPQMMDEVAGLFHHSASLKFIELLLSIDENLPGSVVGDPFRLGQILSNLISNAIKFTDSGQVLINVALVSKTDRHATVRFSVSDTGVGISEEVVPNLFRSFTQADSSTTRRYGGTGLGLAICKKMVELMNGTIWVESLIGRGSTFTFEVDLELQAEQMAQKATDLSGIESVGLSASKTNKTDLPFKAGVESVKKMGLRFRKILVVDDNSINRQVAKELLESCGAEVDTASSGQEAVKLVVNNYFDAIIMDLNMPGMDGYEATRIIRSHLSTIPVIAMTAFSGVQERQKAVESGMNGFICKPIDPDLLYHTVLKWTAWNSDSHTGIERSENGSLDSASGIRRLAGNVVLYQELLNQYIHEIMPRIDELKQAMQKERFEHAAKVVHYIKGVSGNIGLERVFQSSAQLETLLIKHGNGADRGICNGQNARSYKPDNGVWSLFRAFEMELTQSVEVVEAWLKRRLDSNETAISRSLYGEERSLVTGSDIAGADLATSEEDLEAQLRKLSLLLKENDTQAMEQIEIVMASAEVASLEDARQMARKIESLEFDGAFDLLQSVAAQLSIPIQF